MRINVQCEQCETVYTLQMPDGTGTVGLTIDCSCGKSSTWELDAPLQEGQMVFVVAAENVRGEPMFG